MNKLTALLFIVITTVIVAAPVSTRAGLVAFYDFEDDLEDVSGNDYHATADNVLYIATVPSAISGRSAKSFRPVYASNRSIDLPYGDIDFYNRAQTTGVSISFWVVGEANQDDAGGYIFSIGNTDVDDTIYGLQAGTGGSTGKVRRYYRTDDSGYTSPVTSTTTLLDDTYHHVAMTDFQGDVKVYIDGVEDASNFDYTPGTFTPNFMALNALARDPDSFLFTGYIDEVAIYDHVLTTYEVRQLAAGRNPGNLSELETVDGPVAFYGFEDNSIDSTTNVYDGTVVGTATYSTDVATAISSRSTKAFSFNGSSYVTLPHAGIDFADRTQATGASISMWVKGAAQDASGLFTEGWNVDLATDPIYNFQAGDSATSNDDQLRLAYRGDSGSIDLDNVSTASAFDSTWNHIVLTDDSGSVNMYINGAHDSTHSYTPDVGAPFAYSTLGTLKYRGGVTTLFYTGLMDEVAIYDRVLTQHEVAHLAAGKNPDLLPRGTLLIIK